MLRKLLNFLSSIGDGFVHNEQKRREAYLAKSADIYDLEHRMRELDRPVQPYGHLSYSSHPARH